MAKGGAYAQFEWYQNEADRMLRGVERGAGQAWESTMNRANRRAPVLTGRMIGSSRVVSLRDNVHVIEYRVPYAYRQYMGMHFNRPRGGQARWVEAEYENNVAVIERQIAGNAGFGG